MKTKYKFAIAFSTIIMMVGLLNVATASPTPGERKEIIENKTIVAVPDKFFQGEREKLFNQFCTESRSGLVGSGITVTYKWHQGKCVMFIEQDGVQLISPAY